MTAPPATATTAPPATARRARLERWLFVVLALPAIAIVGLLLYTMLGRAAYPYDLEWMEGGLLVHAQRISQHQGIYVAPSVEFVPFLYTPLYPGLLALAGSLFGISYAVGRAISILAVVGTLALVVAAVRRDGRAERAPALAGGLLAAGLYAATYPWVEGWFDLVRGDSLYVVTVVGGLFAVRVWARHPGTGGRWRIAIAGYLLAMAFFAKQTGALFCLTGAVLLALLAWRRLPIYALVSGAVGLGGAWLFERATGGWFGVYVHEILQGHDHNRDRFWQAFGHILGHFPAMTAAIALGLVATAIDARRRRGVPPGAAGLLYWTPVFAVACLVGALGWAHMSAHFNAYLPAMATGALAAGSALPAISGSLRGRGPAWLATALAALVGLGLAVDVGRAAWRPARFVPGAGARAAGDALVARLRATPGDVFVPYHPWYAVLAGKPAHVHRMGLLDLGYRKRHPIAGLREAIAARRFALIVLDDRPVGPELGGLPAHYRMDDLLPAGERPRTLSGAIVEPRSMWVPRGPTAPPPGARSLFDFEAGGLTGWSIEGAAWGTRPARAPLPEQGPVYRTGGAAWASSFHGGDRATGVLESPGFVLGGQLGLRISGGADLTTLRVELVVDGVAVKRATGTGSERMAEVEWNVASLAGRRARLRLIDRATGPWGHLNVDEIWQRD